MSILYEVKPEDYDLKNYEQIGKGNIFTKVTYLINSYQSFPMKESVIKEENEVTKLCLEQSFKDFDIDKVTVERKGNQLEVELSFKADCTWHGKEYVSNDYYEPNDWEDEIVLIEGKVYADDINEYLQKYNEVFEQKIFQIIPSDSIEVTNVEVDYNEDNVEWDYTEEMKKLFELEDKMFMELIDEVDDR